MLEVLAQHATIHWEDHQGVASGPGPAVNISLLLPPVCLESGKASCLWEAWEVASPSLGLENIRALSAERNLLLIYELTDACSANVRRRHAYAAVLPRNVLYLSGLNCTVHRLHRVIEASINEPKLVGDIHAIALVASKPSYRQKLAAAVRQIVQDELLVIYDEDPLWARLRDQMLQHTFGREWFHTRGSIEPGAEPLEMQTLADSRQTGLRRIALVLDGASLAPTSDGLLHFCCIHAAVLCLITFQFSHKKNENDFDVTFLWHFCWWLLVG